MKRLLGLFEPFDRWVLQRSPVVWALRLHGFVPLVLFMLLLWALAVLWLNEPARWLGGPYAPGTEVAEGWYTPESRALEALQIGFSLLALLLGVCWLAAVRVHNRWRDQQPAGRWALWGEHALGCLMAVLLLVPIFWSEDLYRVAVRNSWQPMQMDNRERNRAIENAMVFDWLVSEHRARWLPFWDEVADSPELALQSKEAMEKATIEALKALKHGDVPHIAAQIEAYAQPLRRMGYEGDPQAQAAALVQAYRQQLARHQPQWQALLAQPPAQTEAGAATPGGDAHRAGCRTQACREKGCRQGDEADGSDQGVSRCLQTFAALSPAERLEKAPFPSPDSWQFSPAWVLWQHPSRGNALPTFQQRHFAFADQPAAPVLDSCPGNARWGNGCYPNVRSVLEQLLIAQVLALALLAVRLLNAGQLLSAILSAVVLLPVSSFLFAWLNPFTHEMALLALAACAAAVALWQLRKGRAWSSHLWLIWMVFWAVWGGLAGLSNLDELGVSESLLHPFALCLWLLFVVLLIAPLLRRWASAPER